MKVALIPNCSIPEAIDAAYMLSVWLSGQDIDSIVLEGRTAFEIADPFEPGTNACIEDIIGCDLVVCLGGDGTTLRTARLIGFSGIPLLSLNFGKLGFLSSGDSSRAIEAVSTALAGECAVQGRTTIHAELVFEDGSIEHHFALNEINLARGSAGRIVDYSYSINGVKIAQIRGDGLLVCTPTGSTGYGLSAGGPIVSPRHRGFIVLPIAPHTLVNRAIVTTASDVIEIEIGEHDSGAALYVDGLPIPSELPKTIIVHIGDEPLNLVSPSEGTYYENVASTFFHCSK